MLNLLAAERLKLISSKKLWIVLGLLIFLPIYQAGLTEFNSYYGVAPEQAKDKVINGATGILMLEKNGLNILFIIGAFISFFIGEEFQNGTIRNALSLGRSRTYYYLTKLSAAALVTLIASVIMTALGMICYSILYGFGQVPGISNYMVFSAKVFVILYLLILANISVYVMISFLSKSSGIALVWTFIYTAVTAAAPSLFQHTENFGDLTFWFTESFFIFMNFTDPAAVGMYPKMAVVSIVTIVVSSVIGIIMFKRTDIK